MPGIRRSFLGVLLGWTQKYFPLLLSVAAFITSLIAFIFLLTGHHSSIAEIISSVFLGIMMTYASIQWIRQGHTLAYLLFIPAIIYPLATVLRYLSAKE